MMPFHYYHNDYFKPVSTPIFKDKAPKFTVGDTYRLNTHAEFLNEVFGTNLRAFMRCCWRYKSNAFVWFVRIDGKERNKFTNSWLNKDTIIQRYVGNEGLFDGKPLLLDAPNDYRLVFEIYDGAIRKYVFKGVFLMDRKKSKETEMIFKKVYDCYPMN